VKKGLAIAALSCVALLAPTAAAEAAPYLTTAQAKRAIVKHGWEIASVLEEDGDAEVRNVWASNCVRWNARRVWCLYNARAYSYEHGPFVCLVGGAYAQKRWSGYVSVREDRDVSAECY
jgi:hypothetical protein